MSLTVHFLAASMYLVSEGIKLAKGDAEIKQFIMSVMDQLEVVS